MARVSIAIAAVMGVSAACGAEKVTQERAAAAPEAPAAVRVPENPLDRGIRRDLNLAIGQDTELKHRKISFNVVNGDVTVMGTVHSEHERTQINDIVMNIAGVKSVANTLRVAGEE